MQISEQQLRTLTLAQAIERTDAERTLVSQADLDAATRAALDAARSANRDSGARVGLSDIVLGRAAAVVARAGAADPRVAALHPPSSWLLWLARGLPVVTLLLGLAIDRIANAHRVDLLSPPLLLLLGWNLVMYLLLAVSAVSAERHPTAAGHPWQHTLRRWAGPAATARAGRRALAGRIAADFYSHWFAQTADLFTQRAARVLHLCAAAWAAGFALSLLLRGLIVRYQFGWESTFLDAQQVHTIATLLFWPITTLFGVAPFSPEDIAATQDFAGQGAAGGRWVWMYVGLLVLVVVLPRLALAASARWRERQLAAHRTIDLNDPAFDALRQSLPGDIVLGWVASPLHSAAWRTVMAGHTPNEAPDAPHSPQGDRLRFVEALQRPTAAVPASPAATPAPVDAVITCTDATPDTPVCAAWQAAPALGLRWAEFGESWVLEATLFDRLVALLPQHRHSILRLRETWVAQNDARFAQSIRAVAEHLRACARLNCAHSAYAARYTEQAHQFDTQLRALHHSAAAPYEPAPARASVGHAPAVRGTNSTALAVGTSAGAAAGAAAGAKVGAMIDIGTGGMTLGAGTAVGALLGGTTAWVVRSLQKKDAAEDVLRHITEAACTHYLVIAHEARLPPPDAARIAGRWQAEVTGTVAAHQTALAKALQGGDNTPASASPEADGLQALLCTMLTGILQRSFVPGKARGADPATPDSTQR